MTCDEDFRQLVLTQYIEVHVETDLQAALLSACKRLYWGRYIELRLHLTLFVSLHVHMRT